MKPLSVWIRERYRVEENASHHCRALDRETGKEVGRWEEGGMIPTPLYMQYLDEVPEARAEMLRYIFNNRLDPRSFRSHDLLLH